ncbi:MAG TPA: thioredoxin domain-containing protein [Arthrobacter sp.]|nr:thioredoxin domain-containing protein [Arthrobacter sp.]
MNRLAGESSAYLRQHADNPVHWWPFDDDAFREAEQRDVPVFLSIGYAACHWCHVMAGESFENDEVAAYLNENFVSIKVDREERPDVDAIYMSATQAVTGEGGWPMSVFLTTDGRAFYAGTYFPPSPMPGRASFRQVLQAVNEAWTQRRDQVESSAEQLAAQLSKSLTVNRELIGLLAVDPLPDAARDDDAAERRAVMFQDALDVLSGQEDVEFGGFGNAPKFPPSPVLDWLIKHAGSRHGAAGSGGDNRAGDYDDSPAREDGRLRHDGLAREDGRLRGDGPARAAEMASRTLESMATSALFDQLEGGFARYAVDRKWMVPHFEKMLYDNVQLLRLYARWSRLDGGGDFAGRIAAETAEWMLADLALDPSGAFASSLDADTVVDGVHEEGGTYLWSRAELESVLGTDYPAVADMMSIALRGTVSAEGSALHPGRRLSAEEEQLWERVRPRMREVRRRRPQPARDEKVVAGWNGMAVAALAETGMILGRPDFVEAAERTGRYLAEVHLDDRVLKRVSHDGKAQGIGGLLEDYAFCAEGFFTLYAATGNTEWYKLAEQLTLLAEERFVVEGQLRDSGGESSQLWNAQGRSAAVDPLDSPTPSGAAVFAQALITFAAYSGSHRHRALGEGILGYVGPLAGRAPRAVGGGLAALEAVDAGPLQVAVTGAEGPDKEAMLRAVWSSSSPGLVLAASRMDSESGSGVVVPLLTGRPPGPGGAARAYVCRDMVCDLPAESLEMLLEQLGRKA